MPVTFETQEDFEQAVICAIIEHLDLHVNVRGSEFVKGVSVALVNKADRYGSLLEGSDSV